MNIFEVLTMEELLRKPEWFIERFLTAYEHYLFGEQDLNE